jgi:hypothetical protein
MSAHSSLGIVFLVFSIWHVVLNRRLLVKYLRGAKPRLSGGSREAISAVALVAVALLTALSHIYAM